MMRHSLFNRLCSCLALVATTPPAHHKIFAPSSSISFTISTDKPRYKLGIKSQHSPSPALRSERLGAKCPTARRLWATICSASGRDFTAGFAGSCFPQVNDWPAAGRMAKEAVLLKPGEYEEGTLQVPTSCDDLTPGAYRVEASVTAGTEDKFTSGELAKMSAPFLRGVVPASTRVTLKPNSK